MISTILMPTPRIIKKKIKRFINKYGTKERGLIYTLIGSGIIIISIKDIPAKSFILGSLIYNGIAFEVLEKLYDELENDEQFKKLLSQYNNVIIRTRIMP